MAAASQVFPRTRPSWHLNGSWRQRFAPPLWFMVPVLIMLLLYLSWPYATLWRLNEAIVARDEAVLARLVELPAVREEIARRLNKERPSAIAEFSDDFIAWLEIGIRRNGADALDDLVTLDWVRAELEARALDRRGFLPGLTHAWFEGPFYFAVRLGPTDPGSLHLRLRFIGVGWRLVTLYY